MGKNARGGGTIVIPYVSRISEGHMQIFFELGSKKMECPIKSEGVIEIRLTDEMSKDVDEGAYRLVICVPRLFIPYEEGMNEDRRSLGIAIFIDKVYRKEDCSENLRLP